MEDGQQVREAVCGAGLSGNPADHGGRYSNDGHCYGTREQLLEESEKILEIEKSRVDSTQERMIEEKAVILDSEDAI